MIWSKYFSNSSPLKRQRYFWSYPLQFLLSHLLRILYNDCSSCSSSAVLSQDHVALKIYKRPVWMSSHYPFHYKHSEVVSIVSVSNNIKYFQISLYLVSLWFTVLIASLVILHSIALLNILAYYIFFFR